MQDDQGPMALKSLISTLDMDNKLITRDMGRAKWLLSYLRQPEKDHAFLLLEGIHQGRRLCKVAQFIVKPGTSEIKGTIRFVDVHIEELQAQCLGCIGSTTELGPVASESLINLIEAEQQRAELGLINYVRLATSNSGPSLPASMDFFGSHHALQASQGSATNSRIMLEQTLQKIPDGELKKRMLSGPYYCAESLVKLFVPGHNSCTWAEAILKAMKLPPSRELKKILMNPAEIPPVEETRCTIF
jgi:hypothetical protein